MSKLNPEDCEEYALLEKLLKKLVRLQASIMANAGGDALLKLYGELPGKAMPHNS